MSDATYGELLDIGEKFLIEAALSSRDKLSNAPAAIAAAEGHSKLIKALRANVRVFTELPSVDEERREQVVNNAVTHLAHTLDRLMYTYSHEATPQIDERREANNWISAARALHGAADALRTHLGPERAHRTPDATVLDNPQAQQAVLRQLAEMVLTVSEAQRRLSLRIQEKAVRGPNAAALRSSAMLMLESHAGLTESAGQVIHALTRQQIPDALASLSPALLLRPTLLTNPISAAQRSFQRIRLVAHRQARGEMPSGIDAIRAHATTAALVLMHSHAILSAASVDGIGTPSTAQGNHRLESGAAALCDAARAWDALAKLTERYASTRQSPRLLHHEVNVLAKSLTALTRSGEEWRAPQELLPDGSTASRLIRLAAEAVSQLPDLARAVTAVAEQLTRRGELLMPTRNRDDADYPHRWCPVGTEWTMALRADCDRAETVTAPALRTFRTALFESYGGTGNPPTVSGYVLSIENRRPSRITDEAGRTRQLSIS